MTYLRSSADVTEMRLEMVTPPATDALSFAISPDGRSVTFVAKGNREEQLWLRKVESLIPLPLPGTEGATAPFWAPDSRSIGFFARGKLMRVDLGGGPPQVLASSSVARGGSWGADSTVVFTSSATGPLVKIQASPGSPPGAATTLEARQGSHRYPSFLPNGRQFLYYAQGSAEVQGIYLGSLDSSEGKFLTAADTAGAYLDPGWLVFTSGNARGSTVRCVPGRTQAIPSLSVTP
jgi:Tol biopolymer transport system component